MVLDVTDSEGVTLFDEAFPKKSDERLEILVNNAGLGQDFARVVDLTDEHWEDVLRVTLTGTFYCCRAAGLIIPNKNWARSSTPESGGFSRGLQHDQGRCD